MIGSLLNEKKADIDKELANLLADNGSELYKSMNYSLLAGGKRLRPALFLMLLEIFGLEAGSYMKVACAIECIHTYSLIHDDLPAMDNDDYRRGKLTNHKIFGPGMATMAGDGLLTYAFELISNQENISPDTRCHLISSLA